MATTTTETTSMPSHRQRRDHFCRPYPQHDCMIECSFQVLSNCPTDSVDIGFYRFKNSFEMDTLHVVFGVNETQQQQLMLSLLFSLKAMSTNLEMEVEVDEGLVMMRCGVQYLKLESMTEIHWADTLRLTSSCGFWRKGAQR